MNIKLPCEVNKAINMLIENGYEAYAVGGCVRDLIMGKVPFDYDITTSATPQQTKAVFESYKIIETGIKHGTVTVIINSIPLEITTYRIDGDYTDNRHPENVRFSKNLKDDLSRRDFTINTLCYNESDGLIDLFSGINDIKSGLIRSVGEADKRFNEDSLRIIRALRFASVLNFKIEDKTSQSIIRNKELLKNISIERINVEFVKLICGNNVKDILLKYHCVIEQFIPELNLLINCKQNTPYHIYDVFTHSIYAMSNIENDKVLRLTMFFHDFGKPLCKTTDEQKIDHFKGHAQKGAEIVKPILKKLKFDNKTVNEVSYLVSIHNKKSPVTKTEAKFLLNEIGIENYRRLIKIKRADTSAKSKPHAIDEKLKNMQIFLDDILVNEECFYLQQLSVNGNDLINIGIQDGFKINETLQDLLTNVINDNLNNNKAELLDYVRQKRQMK